MKKWSKSTKLTVLLVVVLIGWGVIRAMGYSRMVHTISHQAVGAASVAATRELVQQRKLARVFKDQTNHAKYQAIRNCQVLAVDPTMIEIEGHHLSVAEAASAALVEFLGDLELPVRAVAADALGRMGKQAARPLLNDALNSPDKDVRSNATKALQAIGVVAVPEMVEAVKGGKPTMKMGAATALGKLQTPRAIDALIGALKVKESEVRLVCRDALVAIGQPSVGPLVVALGDASPFTRRHSAEALGEIGDKTAAQPLLVVVGDEHRQVRLAATYAVGKLRDAVAVPMLIDKLSDADREMREAAAVSLGQIADELAVPKLIALLEDPVEAVREQAATALGRIGPKDDRSLGAIEAASRSTSAGTRLAAVLALGLIGDASTAPSLEDRVDPRLEPDKRVRRRAATALGKVDNPESIPALIAAFSDSDWRVNYLAQDALAELGQPAVEPLLAVFSAGEVLPTRYARKTLSKMSPAPLEALQRELTAPLAEVRVGVAETLADIGSDEALDLLAKLENDPDAKVKFAATRVLKQHRASGGGAAEAAEGAPAESEPAPTESEPASGDDGSA